MKLNVAATMTVRSFFALAAVALLAVGPVEAQATEKSRCFNFESLSPELRARSEAYLLKALDTEHLFTIVSGMKPMSGGFYSTRVATSINPQMSGEEATAIVAQFDDQNASDLDEPTASKLKLAHRVLERARAWQEVEDVRTILATWRCGGEIYADLVHYATPRDGYRQLHGYVFALPALRNVLAEKDEFFSRWAFTPNASPLEVLMAVEYSRDVSRFAGYGYLFGYPDAAVHFFTTASASEDTTGVFVERDFRAIPTFERETGQFTYAVAKGAAETDIDRAMKARAGQILSAYKLRRARYIGPGKAGAAALLRDWFCPSEDHCSPAAIALQP